MLYSVRLLLVAIIISANVPVLFANSCIGSGIRIGGAGVLSKHDVVFVGLTVDNKIVQIPASDGKSELWLRKTVLAVKENFKGAETNEMTVYSPATAPPQLIDGQMVGLGAQEFNFKAATEYLVFADVRNGLLFINDSCGQDATRPVRWDFKDWGLESLRHVPQPGTTYVTGRLAESHADPDSGKFRDKALAGIVVVAKGPVTITSTTADNGSFRIEVPPGDYELTMLLPATYLPVKFQLRLENRACADIYIPVRDANARK